MAALFRPTRSVLKVQGVKSNVAANAEDYSLMWIKVKLHSTR
jgi:hypothetical protein